MSDEKTLIQNLKDNLRIELDTQYKIALMEERGRQVITAKLFFGNEVISESTIKFEMPD